MVERRNDGAVVFAPQAMNRRHTVRAGLPHRPKESAHLEIQMDSIRLHLFAALVTAFIAAACSKQEAPTSTSQPAVAPTAVAQAGKGDISNPCTLVSDAQVRKVFAQAKPGQLDRNLEKHGIVTCVWGHPGGTFYVQYSNHELASWADESRGMVDGAIDPMRPSAKQAVRFEPLSGVGDRAMAIVERKDEARGILNDVAQVVVQVGQRQVRLFSSQLSQRDRAEALKALEELARAAANRL